jgi:L-iditol 2-dehydrogenase
VVTKRMMTKAVWYGPKDLRLEEVPVPEVGAGEVLVEVKAALTCGTDVKIYRRGHPLIEAPYPLGHEFSGVVTEVGPGVEGVEKGMPVVTSNTAPCGVCFYCKRGQANLCDNRTLLYGAYAQYILVPAPIVKANIRRVPEGVTFQEAALVEPLSCALFGVRESNVSVGDSVAVIGAGPIGLFFVNLCKLRGAEVTAIDLSDARLEIARRLGADETVNAKVPDVVQTVKNLTDQARGVDIAIEAAGYPETWEQAIQMARKGGLVTLFGGCKSGTSISISTERLHYLGLTIKGAFHTTPYEIEVALDLIARKAIDTEAFISGEFPLSRVKEALEKHARQEGIKFAIIP